MNNYLRNASFIFQPSTDFSYNLMVSNNLVEFYSRIISASHTDGIQSSMLNIQQKHIISIAASITALITTAKASARFISSTCLKYRYQNNKHWRFSAVLITD